MTDENDGREATYAVLTDETRVRILLALADRYDEAWSSGWPTFSELRTQVGVDDTSRFSYHLTELQDEFVRKVDERYRPRVAALEIVAAIRAGTYGEVGTGDEESDIEQREMDCDCLHCDRALIATYRNHQLYVGCPEHGAAVAYPTPPRATRSRTLNEVIDCSLRKHACDVRLLRDGVCPHCWGTARLSFPRDSVPDTYLLDDVLYATAKCDICWLSYPIPIAHTVLGHPAVETLYANCGLGPRDAQLGSHNLARVSDVSLPESDSPAAQIVVGLGDNQLTFALDEACSVLEHQRQ
jgi:DNA-binding transcriptional ArsR family regulator